MNKHLSKVFATLVLAIIVSMLHIHAGTVESVSKPKHGVIQLKLEKHLSIDSASVNAENPPFFQNAEKSAFVYILSEKPELKIHRFDNNGKLLNSFLSQGEGPGEVVSAQGFQLLGHNPLVMSREKLILFNADGTIKEERKFNQNVYGSLFLENNTFIRKILEWDDARMPIRKIALFNQMNGLQISILCENQDRRDLGVTMINRNIVAHAWITPDYQFVYLPGNERLVYGLSDQKTLYLADIAGKTLKTITLDIRDIPVEEKDQAALLEGLKTFKRRAPDLYSELIKKIPKNFFPILALKKLPGDYFALFTPVGYNKYAHLKVFDQNLNYLYDLEFPESLFSQIDDLNKITFFEKGFHYIDNTGDTNRYIEYHIKNLKKIFK